MKPVEISVEEIKRFMFEELTDLGFLPEETELEAVSEIAFDYMMDKLLKLEEED